MKKKEEELHFAHILNIIIILLFLLIVVFVVVVSIERTVRIIFSIPFHLLGLFFYFTHSFYMLLYEAHHILILIIIILIIIIVNTIISTFSCYFISFFTVSEKKEVFPHQSESLNFVLCVCVSTLCNYCCLINSL